MFRLTAGPYTVSVSDDPAVYEDRYRDRAVLSEHLESGSPEKRGNYLFLSVGRNDRMWPFLVSSQRYAPGSEGGFYPGVLLVPETSLLFVGAGERLLAYRLDPTARLWEDRADIGFLGWKRYGDLVIMSAEIELAVWTIQGEKLWSTFVEPPWDYSVDGQTMHLDVMGTQISFPVHEGLPANPPLFWR